MRIMTKITIRDVARESGVSISTVSQILNGRTKHFNKDTIKRVLQVKDDLNYEADYFAKRMIDKKSRTVGVLVPSISNPFFSKLLEGIESILFTHRYVPIFSVVNRENQKEINTLDELIHRGVDGFIIASDAITDNIITDKLLNQYPFIVLDQKQSLNSLDTILTNDFTGGQLAAEHLNQLGHRTAAIVAPKHTTGNIEQRIAGFKSVFSGETILFNAYLTKESGITIVPDIVSVKAITSIFTVSDEIAFGIYFGLKNLHKSIPKDYSLIGYDNTDMCEYVTPKLTTINQPAFLIGETAANLLLNRIVSKQATRKNAEISVELIVRESTAHLK
ncbi:LacI family transcriptional regulator [Vagococcus vulneris]|uniref:LacI family transcriptional regulator n=2 Tax=Vagococcus vulneris TaxID=1977869 RepID=A0A430A1N1_9ENTE|nr:LacI family DNA-binding transcriptional regulator [Vagococcus vulneris]RSU00274.1 LacI family transcriptional regulator [Vagococcus vulneris]